MRAGSGVGTAVSEGQAPQTTSALQIGHVFFIFSQVSRHSACSACRHCSTRSAGS